MADKIIQTQVYGRLHVDTLFLTFLNGLMLISDEPLVSGQTSIKRPDARSTVFIFVRPRQSLL